MRILIPAGTCVAILWLVTTSGWQHDSHGKKIGAVLLIAAIFAVLEVVVALAKNRGKPAAARPYTAPAKRR